MRAENPTALRFILQDDIYLLTPDKTTAGKVPAEPIAKTLTEPAAEVYTEPVAEKTPDPIILKTPPVKLNYLGAHKKGFLVLVHYTEHEFIADAHLTALESILKRKEYAIDDVAILNMAKAAITDIDSLLTYFDPQKLLVLGKSALPGKIEALTLNQPKQISNVVTLYSFSFEDMMSSTENKKTFWDQMKTL
ncbi:hypothetical protein [Mucilaginibacter sp.]|uniref:hypothetical protein n=1 Tax=Mucilaginibacter sp. TaxID=1882438 RepID=UPI002616B30B|nr:hypothetical protein [Mucilaginibacter sp.]MDB5031878.1 hypothetical protein [Mucilaginibacter sp.]